MPQTIGFIGLGLMGRPMAKNLLKKGYPVVVHNRSRPAVDDLVQAGAKDGGSPAGVTDQCDVVITMVPDAPDVRDVLQGERGVFEKLRAGQVIIDMSTISPTVAKELAEAAAQRGVKMLDAPVSGGEIGAIQGSLSIMIGGDAQTVEQMRPILEAMGNPERIVRIGEAGAGQICKACNQMAIGGSLIAVAEAYMLAKKAGVDFTKVREALMGGFAASRVLEVHGQRMIEGNWKPGFKAKLYAKDYRIVTGAGTDYDSPMPASALVSQFVNAMLSQGMGEEDYSALAKVVFGLGGLDEG